MAVKITVTGMDELKAEMKKLLAEMRDATGEGVTACAEALAEIVRNNTPEGPTKNLKRAVTTKKLPDKPRYPPTTMVGLDYSIAPHQHLVEFGTGPRYHKSGKATGYMPALGFFRRSIDQAGSRIENIMRSHAKKPIERRGG